jgi:ribosomal protein S18 acetylase RimI-like enzyme
MPGDGDPGWTMRPPAPKDAGAVKEVLIAAGVAAWGGFLGGQRIETAVRATEQPADLVAVDGEGVLGFVAWDAATGEVTRLYTHPRAWGRGAGGALLDRALEALRAAGCRQAWLNTEERNEAARRFYDRQGWRQEGPPRVRDWHGARLCEPRYVKDL